jgi:hypothetical protein
MMTREKQNPRKYKFNDEIDRWRCAVALTYCDVLITDSGAAALARAATHGFEEVYPCKIFSVRETAEVEAEIQEL